MEARLQSFVLKRNPYATSFFDDFHEEVKSLGE